MNSDSKILKILLIEDNPGDADLIEEMLSRADVRFELKCVNRLAAGIEQVKAGGLDVILLDLGLPDSRGLDTLMRLKESKPKAPVIVLTGLTDETVGTEAVKAGAQDYLIKGQIDKKLFARSIKYAIERAQVVAEREQYFKFFQTSADLMCFADPNGAFLKTSPAFSETLGYTEAELVSKPFIEFVHPEDKQATLEEMASQQQKGLSLNFENRYICKDGSLRWLSWRAIYIKDEGMTYATARDITERKQMEEELQRSEEFNRNILESVDEGFIVIGRDYRIISANRAFAEQARMDLRDMTGKHCFEISHHCIAPCYEEGEMCAVKQVFDTGESHTVIHTHYDKKGAPCYVETKAYPLAKDEAGRVMTVIEILVDITEKRKAEESLKILTHKIGLILNSVGEGIYGLDLEGKVTFINPAAARMLGYEVEELLGRQSHATWHHHNPDGTALPVEKCTLNEVLKEGTLCAAEDAIFWKKNGTKFPVEYSSTPMFEADKLIGAVVTFRDITTHLIEEQEREKLEDQLRHSQKMEAVGTLAGGIAHDFNNILNVIMGYGGMVNDSLEEGSPSKEQMNEVLAAAERAATLTKRLLVFSRKQAVEVKLVNINELILGLQKMLARIVRESIEIKLNLASSPLMVLADAGQIEQVLMNLASNAKDAMLGGGRLTIGTEIKELDEEYVAAYGYGKPGRYALITVSDTGQGMDEETKKKIFEPFFTTKGIGEGTGLGLAISYGIIKQHSGYIKVYSELGKGTEFKIYLPLIEKKAALEIQIEAAGSAKGGNETILLAEDDASLRKLSRIVLESYGYTVITAEDGEDALTKFMENREKISLALIDMIMPKKNGKEVGEAIRKVSPGTKILFASGYTMDVIMTKELTEGGYDFILKPVRPRDLLKKVREVLDK